jgi:hypothetical protein
MLPLRFLRIQPLAVPLVVFIIDILAIAESNYTEYPITSSILVRRRHKMQKPSNDTAFERLKDWLFCRNSPHARGLRLACDAVVLMVWMNYFHLGTLSYDVDHIPELVKVILGKHSQTLFMLIIDLTFCTSLIL